MRCKRRRGGAGLVPSKFLDQHHPGASRHPSSAEEGDFARLSIYSDLVWLHYSDCIPGDMLRFRAP